MDVHQAVGMAEPPIAIGDVAGQREKQRPVAVILEDRPPGIAPTRQVVDGAGEFEAERAGRGRGWLTGIMSDCKT